MIIPTLYHHYSVKMTVADERPARRPDPDLSDLSAWPEIPTDDSNGL